jgi:hypothetical protein
MPRPDGSEFVRESSLRAVCDASDGDERSPQRMARWRLRLFAWLARHERCDPAPFGLPRDRVVIVEREWNVTDTS